MEEGRVGTEGWRREGRDRRMEEGRVGTEGWRREG